MAVYKNIQLEPAQVQETTAKVREALAPFEAILPDDFVSEGLPELRFSDFTRGHDEAFDPSAFRGCLSLGGNLYNTTHAHTPSGPVRLTINRTGPGDDEVGRITVGEGTDLRGVSIVSYTGVTIGKHVHIEPRVTIMDSDGHPIDRRIPDIPENKAKAPVVIKDGAWIGYGVTITKGVTIGENAVVAPGSVVLWDVPDNGSVLGNPAKARKIFKKYLKES